MPEIYKELGQKIKKYRKSKNLTTAEFATLLNISAGHLSNIENGTYDIFRLELLFKIANELNISLEELLQFECIDVKNILLNSDIKSISTNPSPSDLAYINKWLNALAITYLSTIDNFKTNKDAIESITNHLIDELHLIKKIG
ncbi:helix-turn-helix domain-containing protein [Crassaminicella profunda]|uniref:helix-turn-helix domain-containing protein n=1 Tax=Crassaminicella profunda TaxID=1286698 RepID=UPI001CA6D058|nr:helix-turn-helix transcriptional regulator [Crassaminicella profunda]QZY53892.1 helix-turn-helix domain-containing protein [Crassaminicella profunda]